MELHIVIFDIADMTPANSTLGRSCCASKEQQSY